MKVPGTGLSFLNLPFTPRTSLRSPRNFGNARFRRFANFDFLTPKFYCFSQTNSELFFWFFAPKFLPIFFFRRRKIESCKSSETRVAEVSRRSERSSRGKRTFEVCRRCRQFFCGVTSLLNLMDSNKRHTAMCL